MAVANSVTNFIVISRGRTASTFLAKGLNMHPDIHMANEIFHPNKPPEVNGLRYDDKINSWDFLESNLFSGPAASKGICGFKLFSFHAIKSEPAKAVWRALEERDDIRIISLSRLNLFAAYVSEARARAQSIWHPKPGEDKYADPYTITVDIDRMNRSLDNAEEQFSYGDDLCRRKQGLAITYEALKDETNGTFNLVASWLGASEHNPTWPAFLTSSESSDATRIMNLDEVAVALRNRGSEWMLEPFAEKSQRIPTNRGPY